MNQLKLFQIDNLQTRPPLRYPGSKYGALKIIQKYLPKNNISDYCEPFFGSGAFYFKLVKSDAPVTETASAVAVKVTSVRLVFPEIVTSSKTPSTIKVFNLV